MNFSTELTQFLTESIEESYNNRNNVWKDSPFEKLIPLSNDERGRWGEQTVIQLINKYTEFNTEWNDDSTTKNDGIYDFYVFETSSDRKRIEVKTAGRGNRERANWQHENIYAAPNWDKLMFFDFDVFGFYLTVINYSEMTFDSAHPVFGRKPILRKDQTDKYKFDFQYQQQERGISHNMTFHFNIIKPDETGLSNFLKQRLK